MGQRNNATCVGLAVFSQYLRALIEDGGSLQEEKLKEGHIWILEIQN